MQNGAGKRKLIDASRWLERLQHNRDKTERFDMVKSNNGNAGTNIGSTVNIHTVTIAQTTGNNVGLSAGINPGDVVVIDGQDKLQDGTKVAPSSPPSTGSNAATPPPGALPATPSNPQSSAQPGKKSGGKSK